MAIKTYKPTSPARRFYTTASFDEVEEILIPEEEVALEEVTEEWVRKGNNNSSSRSMHHSMHTARLNADGNRDNLRSDFRRTL